MNTSTTKAEFPGHSGETLAARLDTPSGNIRGFALFAHCFTCSKDIMAAKRIASELARQGIAVLRFDFTGLGSSDGEFGSTNFSSNVQDLVLAADYLRDNFAAPSILIGHSLGGAAVLAAAGEIDEVKAIVTIGAPSDVGHVLHNFGCKIDEIEQQGSADVSLAGRTFNIQKQFIDDAREAMVLERVSKLRKALMVMHAPTDDIVGIEHASAIFTAAKHPKNFVSLDRADHLLSKSEHAVFAAQVISGWVGHYLDPEEPQGQGDSETVVVAETGEGKFQQSVVAGPHRMFADEPKSYGGMDSGPSPYDYLSIALGACTSMTLRLYAAHKKADLGRITVEVSHDKIHANDCADCDDDLKSKGGKIDQFKRLIRIEGGAGGLDEAKIIEIADKCPVHRTLEAEGIVVTELSNDGS